ncbi:chondroitin sulfate synthase 1-like [Glandiceps talaboti]
MACGFFLHAYSRFGIFQTTTVCHQLQYFDPLDSRSKDDNLEAFYSEKKPDNFIYVGVMTAKMYLSSRAVAVNRTWVNSIPGKVTFFSSIDSDTADLDLPLVSLPGVDDTYPPQKKAFLMLKYMHDNYLNKYEWFMRTDDDVYIKGNKLEAFLRSINSSRPQYIGQAGQGNREEFGKLYLDSSDNYCMGGPGVVFSRETLRRIVPNISKCIKSLYSSHEDVEIGRCVKRFAGVNCTWAYEMTKLFYQNYTTKDGFNGDLQIPEVHRAISLHPIKSPKNLYRMHSYLTQRQISDLNLKVAKLKKEAKAAGDITAGGNPSLADRMMEGLSNTVPARYQEILPWEYHSDRSYSTWKNSVTSSLSKAMRSSCKTDRQSILLFYTEDEANIHKKGWHSKLDFIKYGYKQINPTSGCSCLMRVRLKHRKHTRDKWLHMSEKYTFLTRPFGKIEFLEIPPKPTEFKQAAEFQQMNQETGFGEDGKIDDTFHREHYKAKRKYTKDTVHFVIPLAGRPESFKRFMKNFEEVCIQQDDNVKLVVVLFDDIVDDEDGDGPVELVHSYQRKYPYRDIRVIFGKEAFSRGLALQLGASQFPDDALLFFLDVDLQFSTSTLNRCRANTLEGTQVYYPVMFSLYDPDITDDNNIASMKSTQLISKLKGFFRDFSFGMLCAYHSDVKAAGGFDLAIQGWGGEDVDLFDKFVKHGFTVFRVPDIDLVHVYHTKYCDPKLTLHQYKNCIGSKSMIIADTQQLAELVEKKRNKQL